ncbi:MAG: hypothetical protein C5B53_08455 [Candidatus Melainabacteria bacterium]|nr:MAG: hypothetical protein C5B53_08455 [Candidatus Melainabacteria bacterium]
MSNVSKERLFLRQWVGERVLVVTVEHGNYSGILTNIVFDQGNRLIYIMLDDKQCLNFDQIIEITLSK